MPLLVGRVEVHRREQLRVLSCLLEERDDVVARGPGEEPCRQRSTRALELLVSPGSTRVDDRSRPRPLTAHGEEAIADRRRGGRPGHSIFEARTEIVGRGLTSRRAIEHGVNGHEVADSSIAMLGRFRKRGYRVFSIETTPRDASARAPSDTDGRGPTERRGRAGPSRATCRPCSSPSRPLSARTPGSRGSAPRPSARQLGTPDTHPWPRARTSSAIRW